MISWTIAKLKAKSIHERHLVWLRAKAIMETNDEAKALVHLIETSGLDYAKDRRGVMRSWRVIAGPLFFLGGLGENG
jgi:hypothetical protein